jgi:DNA-damage-inducible protein J
MLIMTTKTQTSLRLDTDKLIEAKAILERLGLNFSEAVNIFTSMIVETKGLPFDVCLPNDETIAAMRDVRARKNLTPVALTDLQRELQHP